MITLIEQAKAGDEQAFLKIYDHYYPFAYRQALKSCRCEADAKDVLQEVFLSIHKNLPQLRQCEYFSLWMSRIVLNEVRRFYNILNKTISVEDENLIQLIEKQGNGDIYEDVHKITDKDVLYHLIDELPKKQGDVLKLVYIKQRTTKEVAHDLGLAEGTVKSRVFQAKKSLKKQVDAFEAMEGRKLSIQVDGILAISSIGILSKIKMFAFQGSALNVTGICAGTVLLMSFGMVGLSMSKDHPLSNMQEPTSMKEQISNSSFRPVSFKEKKINSPKSAYFVLKLWAPDIEHLRLKTPAEKQEILSVYQELMDSHSPYIELLRDEEWIKVFEQI